MSNFKKIIVRNKSYREVSMRSDHSWTQNYVLEITHPRNILIQYLFMTCAWSKQETLSCSFWSIHYIYFVISRITLKTVLPLPVKGSVNGWNKDEFDRYSCMDFMNSIQLYLLNEQGDLFYITYFESLYCGKQSGKV